MRFRLPLVIVLVCFGAVTAGFAGPLPTSDDVRSPAESPTATTAPPSLAGAESRPEAGPVTSPTIHAVYPDPIRSGDRGEFVILALPNGTALGQYALTDGDTTTALPNRTVSGRVAVTAAPDGVRNLTDYTVVGLDGAPALANGGDLGLDAAVFTSDYDRAMRLADRIEAGAVRINGAPSHGLGDIPFGGVKRSGIGREGINYTIDAFVREKTIVL